jgi:basic amino acid/polyamine antiporter, APA family
MAENNQLVKGLGLFGAVSVAAGTMIGTAIFVVPGHMLGLVGTPGWVILVWISAGVLSLFGALGYSELGAAIPEAGGEYVYLHRAYSPGTGFLFGWTTFVIAKPASIAAISTAFVIYFSYFFPALTEVVWQTQVPVPGHAWMFQLTGLQLGAALMIALLSGINILGVRRAGNVQVLFTACKLAVLAVLIVLGLALGQGSFAHFSEAAGLHTSGSLVAAFGVATVLALYAYDGWNNLSMVAGEVKDPQRNIPRALIGGTILVVAVYVLVNLAYFHVLAPASAVATQKIAADAAQHLMGNAGGAFVAVGVMISAFATLNGSIMTGARVPYATARDGLFPAVLGRLHRRFHTPVASIVAQGVLAGAFALTGTYDALATKVIFSEFLFYALVTAGIFVLRRREPGLDRPYRTWGYPIVPAVFVALSVLLLVNTFVEKRSDSLWGLLLVGSGVPAYFLWKSWKNRKAS